MACVRKQENVLALRDDAGMTHESHESYPSRHGKDRILGFVAAVGVLTVAVLSPVVSAEPVGFLGVGVAFVERNGILVFVAVLLELHTSHLTAARQSDPRIVQAEQWKVGVVRDERLGDRRDRLEVVLEPIDAELATPSKVEQALGMNDARIVRLAGNAAGRQSSDELLDFRTEAQFSTLEACLLDLVKLRHVTQTK